MDVLGPTIRPITVNKLDVTALQQILTPLFITVDMFSLVVPFFFLFIQNDDCLVQSPDAMMPFIAIKRYKCTI